MSCPGDLLSGLVDGELPDADRERVHSHLLRCTPCREEVEALRALKLQLSWTRTQTPPASEELTARLLAMVIPDMDPAARVAPGTVRPVSVRPAGRPAATRGPGRRRTRRAGVGATLLALGLTGAFVLGGPAAARETEAPIDPATDSFFTDYVSTTVEMPLRGTGAPAVVGSAP